MRPEYWDISLRLLMALSIGAAIGMERSYSGRAAGFRTHALVSVSTSLLMLLTVYQGAWIAPLAGERLVLDPTRMAQGIMTGIGFLGAGAIVKSGANIHGLTTAASLWITAAIGILVGIGFYWPALAATVITLVVLTLFRWIEARAPAMFYAQCVLRFDRAATAEENGLRRLIQSHGFAIADVSYRLDCRRDFFEYRFTIRSMRTSRARRLNATLAALPDLQSFRLSPTGD